MCAIEAQLENMLGTFQCQMRGKEVIQPVHVIFQYPALENNSLLRSTLQIHLYRLLRVTNEIQNKK